MTRSEKIQELNELWLSCLVDYHKSCDPKHEITMEYQGGDLQYIVCHFGYIGPEYTKYFNTLSSAENYLFERIKNEINNECHFQIEKHKNPSDWDKEDLNKDIDYWNNILLKLGEIISLKIDDVESNIDEEEYWDIKKKYQNLKYQADLATAILDKEKIPLKDTNYDMEYSLNYRVELLIKTLRNQI